MISSDLACKGKDSKLRFERHLWLSTDCSPDSSVLSEPSGGLPPGCCLFTLTVCLLSVSVRLDVSECVGCARRSCAFVDLVYLYSPGVSPAARLWQWSGCSSQAQVPSLQCDNQRFMFLFFHFTDISHIISISPSCSINICTLSCPEVSLYAVTCYIHTLMLLICYY